MPRLPLRSPKLAPGRTHSRIIIIAHHLILTGYGHWVGNDIRGSGSDDVRNEALRKLGPIHKGRKKVQPSREELRACHKKVGPCLAFDPVWYDEAKRQAIGLTFKRVVKKIGYTVWACAVLRNHAHLVVRRHRDDAVAIWRNFGLAGQAAVREFNDVDEIHPIWSGRPYKVLCIHPLRCGIA